MPRTIRRSSSSPAPLAESPPVPTSAGCSNRPTSWSPMSVVPASRRRFSRTAADWSLTSTSWNGRCPSSSRCSTSEASVPVEGPSPGSTAVVRCVSGRRVPERPGSCVLRPGRHSADGHRRNLVLGRISGSQRQVRAGHRCRRKGRLDGRRTARDVRGRGRRRHPHHPQ